MYSTAYLNQLKNDDSFTFQQIHTSGHATVSDLMKFAKAMNSDKIIPIHTAYPEKFKVEFEKEGFDNVHLWEDGTVYEL
jgi:ribonuclease J